MWKNHFLVAPGEAIYSDLPNGQYGYMSGTSMATPVVAGAAALLQARWPRLKLTPDVTAQILLTTATDKGAPGVDGVYGRGLLNVAAAFRANGVVSVQSPTGTATVISGTTTTTTGTMSKLPAALADVTVFDSFGRDFPLAETGAMQIGSSRKTSLPRFGRRLVGRVQAVGAIERQFDEAARPLGFSHVGAADDGAALALPFDRSLRMGVDLPFADGVAQFRLTGPGDARLDFARDESLQLLAYFPSNSLLSGTVLGNTAFRLSDSARVMAYGFVTTGDVSPVYSDRALDPLPTDRVLPLRIGDRHGAPTRRQAGGGTSLWLRPDPRSLIGLNISALIQKGGYYTLESDIASFSHPTAIINVGAVARRRFADLSVSLSGEMTHLQMAGGVRELLFTPAKLASAELALQTGGLAFRSGPVRDGFAVALVVPPRAVAGNLRLDYLAPTADRLDLEPVSRMVPISHLGRDPVRVEFAYGVAEGDRWSFSLSGGTDLERAEGAEGTSLLANVRLAL